jgi:hypothetical protein
MTDDKITKTKILLTKKENQSLKKLNKCKKTKCVSLYNKYQRQSKKFDIEQDKICSKIKSKTKYYDCSDKFYETSSYKQLFNEYVECGKRKCKKEKLHHKKTMDNTINFYVTHNINPTDNVPNH